MFDTINYRQRYYRKQDLKKLPIITIFILLINVFVFLFIEIKDSTENVLSMMKYGATFEPLIIYNKEYYRLVTSMFLHFGIDHITSNMIFLVMLGREIENLVGRFKFLIVYMLSGIIANIVSVLYNYLRNYYVVGAGASGAVFGIMGMFLYFCIVVEGERREFRKENAIIMIIYSLYSGFVSSNVNNVAHVVGLISGIIISVPLLYNKKSHRNF
jgi:Uncharacterized membrane protein (homolog of Drosophila rhomboid)